MTTELLTTRTAAAASRPVDPHNIHSWCDRILGYPAWPSSSVVRSDNERRRREGTRTGRGDVESQTSSRPTPNTNPSIDPIRPPLVARSTLRGDAGAPAGRPPPRGNAQGVVASRHLERGNRVASGRGQRSRR